MAGRKLEATTRLNEYKGGGAGRVSSDPILRPITPSAAAALAHPMLKPELMHQLRIAPGKRFRLKDHDPGWHKTHTLKKLGKKIPRAFPSTL